MAVYMEKLSWSNSNLTSNLAFGKTRNYDLSIINHGQMAGLALDLKGL